MNCHDFHKMIHRLLDEELGEREKRKLEEHLERCEDCARFLEEHKRLKSLFRPETVTPPGTLRPRILAALEAASRSGPESRESVSGRRAAASRVEVRVLPLFRRAALAALLFLAVSAALFFGGLAPLTAENRDSEIHYEDLFSIAPPGALLGILSRTQSPAEAMRLATTTGGFGNERGAAAEGGDGTEESGSSSPAPAGPAHERKGGER